MILPGKCSSITLKKRKKRTKTDFDDYEGRQLTPKDPSEKDKLDSKKVKRKSNLGRGDPSDIQNDAEDLKEQVFSSK